MLSLLINLHGLIRRKIGNIMSKLYVGFIWHMHQPYYKDVSKKTSVFPWVRLHAIKNYYNMVSILKDFPKIRQTFNFVPSLLLQIKEYIDGETTDLWLEKTLKRVSELTDEDKVFILENFFLLNKVKMGFIFPRYKELYDKKINREYYTEQDFLDLQVLYNLAWFDPELRESDLFLRAMKEKGKDFTEEEKIKLVEKQFEIMKQLFDIYKSLQESGQIEIIFSPFFHPIMPLLLDTMSAKISTPDLPLPFIRFSYNEDAKKQISLGKDFYKEIFGVEPKGMWPPEQAVSPEFMRIITEFDINWIVTDEKILFKTLGEELIRDNEGFILNPELLYKPYRMNLNGKEIFVLFRDQFLSDRIGFVYMNYPPKEGAEDLYNRLLKIKASLPDSNNYLVVIALDGENCWEYYDNDGRDFLRHLYTLLSHSKEIETITIKDYLKRNTNYGNLDTIFPGSWINADFTTWMGEIEENLGWEYLAFTRKYLEKRFKVDESLGQKLDWKSLLAAEGSDWFWWYGEDQESGYDEIFDDIFRTHLRNVFKSINKNQPSFLNFPIVFKNPLWKTRSSLIITPKVDGNVTNSEEWEMSSLNLLEEGRFITGVYYGYDLNNLYLRIDSKEKFRKYLDLGYFLELDFYGFDRDDKISFKILKNTSMDEGIEIAYEDILEIAISWQRFNSIFNRNSKIYFKIKLFDGDNSLVEEIANDEMFHFHKPTLLDEIITKLYLLETKNRKVKLESWLVFRRNAYNLYTKINIFSEIFGKDHLEIMKYPNIVKIVKHISVRELLLFFQFLKDFKSFCLVEWYIYNPISDIEKVENSYLLRPSEKLYRFLKGFLKNKEEEIPISFDKAGSIEIYGL